MAFTPQTLDLAVDTLAGGNLRVHFYSTADDEDTVTASGYFVSCGRRGMRVGDLVIVAQSNGSTYIATVSVVSAAGHATARVDNNFVQEYETVAAVAAAHVSAVTNAIRTQGYWTVGDGGGALYKRKVSQPSHIGRVQSADLTWWEIAEAAPTALQFGAKGDDSTDNRTILQGYIDYLGGLTARGVFKLSRGVFRHSGVLNCPYDGITFEGESVGTQVGGSTLKNTSTGSAHCLHIGDTAETSVDGDHITGVVLRNLTLRGNASSGQGLRVYNATVYAHNLYVVANGGHGVYLYKAWGSHFDACLSQANSGDGFHDAGYSNAMKFTNCKAFSQPLANGIALVGPSVAVTIDTFDGEGMLNGIYMDNTAGAPVSGGATSVAIINPNLESNLSAGIRADGGTTVGLTVLNGLCYGANNGISLAVCFGVTIIAPQLSNCALSCSGGSGVIVLHPKLGAGATITGVTVIASDKASGYPDGALVLQSTGPWVKQNGTYFVVSPRMSSFVVNNSSGGATQNIDMTSCNDFCCILTNNGATGLTLTDTNDVFSSGQVFTLRIENDSSGSGTVVLPTGFKKTAAVAIPANGKSTTLNFVKDANGVWWESSRAVDAT